MQPGVPL